MPKYAIYYSEVVKYVCVIEADSGIKARKIFMNGDYTDVTEIDSYLDKIGDINEIEEK